MKLNQLQKASKIIYVGYGKEGQSSKKFLEKNIPKTPFEIQENIQTPLETENSQEFFVISPGIDRKKWLKNIPKSQQTSNTEIFFSNISEKNRQKTIGISGSKGKSTTTKFIFEALKISGKKVSVGGNFGVPLLDVFSEIPFLDYLIIELSSFQLEHLSISPYFGIFLSFFPDHLDRHSQIEEYFKSKQNLWNGSEKQAKHIIFAKNCETDPQIQKLLKKFPISKMIQRHVSGIFPGIFFEKESVFTAKHFLENFGTTEKLFEILNHSQEFLRETAKNFKGLPYRTEYITNIHGHNFYDDSIATNLEASIASIEFFGNKLGAIILGGKPEGIEAQNFTNVFQTLLKKAPQAFVWLPTSECKKDLLKTAKHQKIPRENIIEGDNFEELLIKGVPKLPPNTSVVLSPGAKSFDRFKNYAERGIAWKKSVLSFQKNSPSVS